MQKTIQQKPITAWAVEFSGTIHPQEVFPTRQDAREYAKDVNWGFFERERQGVVRKVKIEVIKGAR